MNSKELAVINNNLPQEVIQKRKQTLTRWLMNFGEDTAKRIPVAKINIREGLKETRLMHLKQTFEQKELAGIVALQITDLQDFLNVKQKMTAKQIFDTAEFIINDYEFFSLTHVQDCFNRIKKAESPFNGSLYSSIDGRKILEALQKYDELIDEAIFGKDIERHNNNLRSAMENPRRLKEMINKIKRDV
ncbi:MAG: hypothetical protein L3J56_06345 [Bacteroidales bacterium]|nr:hypothetical protein [Bacteroidales bacterium]